MGYQDGVAAAESKLTRFDWFGQKKSTPTKATCDQKYGWKKGAGGKCIRLSPKEDVEQAYGTDLLLLDRDKELFRSFWEKSAKGGSDFAEGVQNLTKPPMEREKVIKWMRDYSRSDHQYELDGNEAAWNKEMGRQRKFYMNPDSKNKYGTPTYLSGKEEQFIEATGGLGQVKGMSKDREINYLRDAFMTTPKYSNTPQKDIDLVNEHYFGK